MKINSKKRKNRKSIYPMLRFFTKAFTSFEIIIVIAIVSILALTSVPFLSGFLTQTATTDTYNRLTAELRKAQTYALLGKQNSPWGVYYGSSGGANKIILYQGSSYATHADKTFDESYTVNPNVKVTGLNDIFFSQVTGTPSAALSISITGNGGSVRTIQIGSQGIINYANPGPTYTPPPPSPTPAWANWYSPNWQYRQVITVDHTKIGVTHANYPIAVILSSNTNLESYAQPSGNDILFTDSSGTTKIPSEIEKYTSSNGALVAFVNVPSLSSTADTVLYMYYGNPQAANQQNVSGTWNNLFDGVWHMTDTPPGSPPLDSTGNGNNFSYQGTWSGASAVQGQIAGGLQFNGTNDYLEANSAPSLVPTGAFSTYMWVKFNSLSSTDTENLFYLNFNQPGGYAYQTFVDSNKKLHLEWKANDCTTVSGGQETSTTLQPGVWYFLVITRDASGNVKYYINGVLQQSSVNQGNFQGTMCNRTGAFWIGSAGNNGHYTNGIIDEARLINIAYTPDCVTTDWNNFSSPSTFYSLSTLQTY